MLTYFSMAYELYEKAEVQEGSKKVKVRIPIQLVHSLFLGWEGHGFWIHKLSLVKPQTGMKYHE